MPGYVRVADGEIFTIVDFWRYCSTRYLQNHDGFAHPAIRNDFDGVPMENPSIILRPDMFFAYETLSQEIPSDATHISWYNR